MTPLVYIEIFPNPVGEVLNFSLNLDEALKTATIYNLSGKAVKTLDLTQSTDEVRSFNISDLKAGSYILKIENGNTAKEIRLWRSRKEIWRSGKPSNQCLVAFFYISYLTGV